VDLRQNERTGQASTGGPALARSSSTLCADPEERTLMVDRVRRRLPLLVAVLTLTLGACDGSSTSTTSTTAPTETPVLTTETFTGSVGQGGTAIHPFPVKLSGYSLLAGFTSLNPSSQTSLGLGIGTWDASTATCGLNQLQNDAAKAGSTALTGTASAANYCVRVYDGGNIAAGATVGYAVQVQHY
jgi:hypothetical protein